MKYLAKEILKEFKVNSINEINEEQIKFLTWKLKKIGELKYELTSRHE